MRICSRMPVNAAAHGHRVGRWSVYRRTEWAMRPGVAMSFLRIVAPVTSSDRLVPMSIVQRVRL